MVTDFTVKLGHTRVSAVLVFVMCVLFLVVCKKLLNKPVQAKVKVPLPAELIVVGQTLFEVAFYTIDYHVMYAMSYLCQLSGCVFVPYVCVSVHCMCVS